MNYTCPVCGYNQLEDPPSHHEICPSCGTQFGYHDITKTNKQLRDRWIARGLHWHSKIESPPIAWNPYVQLVNLQNTSQIRLSRITKATSIKTVRIDRTETRLDKDAVISGDWEIVENLGGVRLAHA